MLQTTQQSIDTARKMPLVLLTERFMTIPGIGVGERKRADAHPEDADSAPDSTPDEEISRADGRWSLWLIEAIGLLLIAALWTAVTVKLSWEEVAEEQAIAHRTMSLARVFEEHTIRTLDSVDQALRFVKFQYEAIGDGLDIGFAVEQGMIVNSMFNQVGVINADGIYHLSNLADFARVDLNDREHFNVHKVSDSGAVFISKPVLGRASGKWSIQLTRRINRPDGSFGGVAVISVDPFYFTSFYNDVDVGKHGVITLVGLDGLVRARRAGLSTAIGQDLSDSVLFRELDRAPTGHFTSTSPIDGVARSISYRRVRDLPLIVNVGVERGEAFSDFQARRKTYLAFAGGMSVVILAFCVLSIGMVHRQRGIAERLRAMKIRAESANRLKSQFLASVSHELRTPLNGVIGYAELLTETLEVEENRRHAKVIFDSSQHLLALLNSILDMARVESGEMRLHPGNVDLRAMIEDVCNTYLPVARSKQVELTYSAPEGATLYCDRVRVVQVLNNLVHNALKFTDHGRVSIDARLEGGNCVVEVSDTGCGIDSLFHEQIFERFRQVDMFETRQHGGAGLGLALCRELAVLMGGRVTVRSTPGEGSVFRFCLPNNGRGDQS